MQHKGSQLAVFCMTALLSSVSFADCCAYMSTPDGWYLEGNIGSTHLSNTNYPGSTSSSGVGANANLGYKFMPYGALEIGYSRYTTTDITASNDVKAAEVDHYSYDVAVRGILPIADSGAEAFAKLGAQRIVARVSIQDDTAANELGIGSSSHSSTGLYIGLGGQYYFSPELAVVVQWQRAQGSSSTGTADLFSVGLSFLFI